MYIYNIYVCKSTYTHIYEEKKKMHLGTLQQGWITLISHCKHASHLRSNKENGNCLSEITNLKKKEKKAEKTVKVQIA